MGSDRALLSARLSDLIGYQVTLDKLRPAPDRPSSATPTSALGEVMPGGEDWQLYRSDGDTELYARYLLKTHDGHIIQVINRVLMHYPPKGDNGEPYVRSVIDLEAPLASPYEYLNHAIFFGTLTQPTKKPGERPYVVVGVYKLL